MSKPKYWIALGGHEAFTRDDHYIFQTFLTGQTNGKGYHLSPKFIEAEDLEDARSKLHAFIDERINQALNVAELGEEGKRIEKKRAAIKAAPTIPDSDIESLSIGVPVNVDPEVVKSKTPGLLDLNELL